MNTHTLFEIGNISVHIDCLYNLHGVVGNTVLLYFFFNTSKYRYVQECQGY